ncbi:MAG: MFS transporter [Lapillicoccus sp.]
MSHAILTVFKTPSLAEAQMDTRDLDPTLTEPPQAGRTWYSAMDGRERRTFWGCFAGWSLDAFDVQLYSLAIPVLLTIGFLTDIAQAGLIGTAALLSSAVGGWAAGILSDRIGRVRTLQLTVLWFATFTGLSGLAMNADQLLVARTLMGFGFGGEWAAGAVLMGETVRARYRGRAIGSVQSGWAIGWGVAVLASTVVYTIFADQTGWRVLFFLGLLPAFLVVYLRRHVAEPEVRKEAAPTGLTAPIGTGWRTIFSPQLIKRTLLCAMLCTGAQGGYYSLTTFLPQFLAKERGLKIYALGATLILIIAGAFAGYLFGAWLTDKLGRRPALVLTAAAAFVMVIPMTALNVPVSVFTILCFPLGFFGSAYFSGIGPALAEQFPTLVRGSGMGFSYNFGRGIGALFPFLVGTLATSVPLGVSIAVFAGGAYAVMIVAALLLTETRGSDLSRV